MLMVFCTKGGTDVAGNDTFTVDVWWLEVLLPAGGPEEIQVFDIYFTETDSIITSLNELAHKCFRKF